MGGCKKKVYIYKWNYYTDSVSYVGDVGGSTLLGYAIIVVDIFTCSYCE